MRTPPPRSRSPSPRWSGCANALGKTDWRRPWSAKLRLLADRLVELEVIESVSHETVRQTLLTNQIKPWLKRPWCIAPAASADFGCRMEDALEVYQRPFHPRRPVVCLDETTRQLVRETRPPGPAAAGRPVRYDYEYERQGVASLFMRGCPR